MHIFNTIFGKIFDVIFWPFQRMSPWVGMAVISLLTGLFMLFIFRHTSNQAGIRKVKNRIKAHLLELRLFKDNLGLSLKAQGNILKNNARYIGYSGKPLLVMIIPLVLILIQLNFWFGYLPLQPGEKAILKVKLKEGVSAIATAVDLRAEPPLVIETPALRIEEEREIDWRFSASEPGFYNLEIIVDGVTVTKTVQVIRKSLQKITPIKPRKNFIDQVFNPGEKPISSSTPLESIEVTYPEMRFGFLGLRLHWIIAYFALSIVFGFALKGVFGVEI